MDSKLHIPAAKLLSSRFHIVPDKLHVTEYFFQVPLDYARPEDGPQITLFARAVSKHETHIFPPDEPHAPKPYMVYLQGGPGFGNPEPQDHPLTHAALPRGYQVLYIDHRGTGLSTPVGAEMLARLNGGVKAQVNYLQLMRQDNTVRDCEAVRKLLTNGLPDGKTQWSIFGQSYGGFINLSYLSMHPEGLREAFFTGGLAPVGKTADQVYQATFRKTAQRNEQYYKKFPEDIDNVRHIAKFIEGQAGGAIKLPGGGKLTVPRFLTIGIAFGAHGGFDTVHAVVLKLKTSLDQLGFFSRAVLSAVETFTNFDSAIIYAILHEAIYCDGPGQASNWAAQRVGESLDHFSWLRPGSQTASADSKTPLFFSGEMIFPMHFDTHPELLALREAANQLAKVDDWKPLYDKTQLAQNIVPCYAASYVDDMFVENEFARNTAALTKGIKVFETNVMYHNALRARSDEVFKQLFNLRDNTID